MWPRFLLSVRLLTCKIENHIIVRMKGNGVCGILGQHSLIVDDCSMKEGRKEGIYEPMNELRISFVQSLNVYCTFIKQ